MQHFSIFGTKTTGLLGRFSFAAAISVAVWLIDLWLNTLMVMPVTPFLPGFAAVIASAAWAGFGPGLLSTGIVTVWCALLLHGHNYPVSGVIIRCLIFAAEGILLSFGSARLHRATRRALRGERWHRSLVDTSNEGIWVVDSNSAITYSNPRIAEMLGCRTDDIVGKRAEEFFFPSDFSIERIRFQNRRAGQREQFDRRLRRKDGAEVWVLASCSPFPDRAGKGNGVLAMMTDITERKSSEQALRLSETRFRGLFENVLEGVYQSTPEGRILAANPMLLNMLGLSSEAELSDVNIARDLYVDPNVRKRLLELLEREGSFRNVEYQLRHRDGKAVTVRENARVVRDKDGRVAYYEGTLSDVTGPIRNESEMLKPKSREGVDTIAASIPHEFRNIFTVISGYSKLMQEDLPESHPAHAAAQNILNAVEGASALAAQLVAFSNRTEQSAVDINRAILLSQAALQTTGLALSPWSLPIMADQQHVEQIVSDLLRDAQHVSAEAVRIDPPFVHRHAEARTGLFAKVTVRAASGSEPLLSKTRDIVSRYGGFILESSVYLPIAGESAPFLVARLAEPKPREIIMLVEEEPLIREVSRDLLERQGYGVILAADAREAERIEKYGHPFDLLIADLSGSRAGITMARRLRSVRSELKVLLIVGKADHRTDFEWADAYLEKPYSAEALNKEIRRIFGERT